MSYDLRVWSVREPALPSALPETARWVANGDGWRIESRGWQIVVSAASRVLPEDLPEEVEAALPGISHQIEVNLEPTGAPEAARKLAQRAAKELARAAHGVVEDPQTDSIILPSGVKRFAAPAKQERIDVVAMSWWCDGERFGSAEGIEAFLTVLEKTLPEAMPRRYGPFEPPQHVYETTGRAHFAEFLRAEKVLAVWYPNRPVRTVSFQPASQRLDPRGFRASHTRIDIETGALHQPGWKPAIARAWRAISSVLRPFYGDARILRGFVPGRATLFHDGRTESHPVRSGWWAGIPASGAFAAVVGPPYLAHWPRVAERTDPHAELAFLETDTWSAGADVFREVGGVPTSIANRPSAPGSHIVPLQGQEYPPVFPFPRAAKGS